MMNLCAFFLQKKSTKVWRTFAAGHSADAWVLAEGVPDVTPGGTKWYATDVET